LVCHPAATAAAGALLLLLLLLLLRPSKLASTSLSTASAVWNASEHPRACVLSAQQSAADSISDNKTSGEAADDIYILSASTCGAMGAVSPQCHCN
jgi:hypothetical protein